MEMETTISSRTTNTSSNPGLIDNPLIAITKGLAELKIKHIAGQIQRDFEQMPDSERAVLAKYLLPWMAGEKSERATAIIAARIRCAKFRKIQTIEMYDFKHSKLTERIEKSYLGLHQNLNKNDRLPKGLKRFILVGG
jgi:hypothetical protein